MEITIDQIKKLRESTGISMTSCKKALEESNGDQEKAIEILRKKGEAKSAERAQRSTDQGFIDAYIHSNGKMGTLIALACETDFVAKNEEFRTLAHDIAMHITATNPLCISSEEISPETINKEREIWIEELKREKKPENIWENILKGKEKKFREENCLLNQPFVKNPETTIENLLKNLITKMGENIRIKSFSRFTI